MAKELRPVALCLLGLALALVVVGTVSGTIVRHIVQIAPLASVGLLARRPAVASSAALPIFALWMAIAVLIWMFLLGVSVNCVKLGTAAAARRAPVGLRTSRSCRSARCG